MRTIFFLLIFFPICAFAQTWQLNDSTYAMTKEAYEKMYSIVVNYNASQADIKLLKKEIELYKKLISNKDSVSQLKDTIIHTKDNQLADLEKKLNSISITPGIGIDVVYPWTGKSQLSNVTDELLYGIIAELDLKISRFKLNPSVFIPVIKNNPIELRVRAVYLF